MPVLVILFIVVPLAELFLLLEVGAWIGALPTIGLVLLTGVIGAALARSQGRVTWRRFNEALAAGRVPAREIFDGVLVIFGGALLLTPGFITDGLGILLLLPASRAVARRVLAGRVMRRATVASPFFGRSAAPGAGPSAAPTTRAYDINGTAREVPESSPKLGEPGNRG